VEGGPVAERGKACDWIGIKREILVVLFLVLFFPFTSLKETGGKVG
jgi:hypothetical protein